MADEKYSKSLITDLLEMKFDIEKFRIFSKNLFKWLDDYSKNAAFEYHGSFIKESFCDKIIQYQRIGKYNDSKDDSGNKIDVLAVKLKNKHFLEHARTEQRNFVTWYLDGGRGKIKRNAALVAFFSDDSNDWRLSFVKIEYKDFGKTKEFTLAKRSSFLVGVNEKSHTAQKQFLNLFALPEDKRIHLTDIEKAFSIEVVTKEFFEKYRQLFIELRNNLETVINNDTVIKNEFENKSVSVIDFSKKLLGQIVFLYFLQKKGWLGVEKNKEWGSGPKNFLRKLFDKQYTDYGNFFNEILEPFFYEVLAIDRSENHYYYSAFKCKIPFLNGGLFEPLQNYDWVNTDIILPNEIFSNTIISKEGDIGTGILDVFDRYNFTVREDEPLEKEVAVDPEMLGKVFENLLEEEKRKSQGAFYTPREIVHYMCQESLINFIANEFENKISKEEISEFIKRGEYFIENDLTALEKENNEVKQSKYSVGLPDKIRQNAEKIDEIISEIKVCDPAIGSGAFLVGMMTELIRARHTLTTFTGNINERTSFNFKWHAIQNNLYGVDIEPSAVDIAKLRLWLSLVVDENDISHVRPLPNLDYKIMQGDSLVEEFNGIKLFDQNLISSSQKSSNDKLKELELQRKTLERQYLKIAQGDNSDRTEKIELYTRLDRLSKAIRKLEKNIIDPGTHEIDDLFSEFSESEQKARELKRLHLDFFEASQKNKKNKIRKEIDNLEWELIEATLKEQNKENVVDKLIAFKKTNVKPFFLWKLHFSEVFLEKNGFDVIIGNPPYIQIQSFSGKSEQKAWEDHGYETYTKTGDIYCLFYERGYNLLKSGGVLTYITSNKWMRANYGKAMRNFFLNNGFIDQIIDFGDSQIFENATTYTNILIYKKIKSPDLPNAWDLSRNYEHGVSLEAMLSKNEQCDPILNEDSFVIVPSEHKKIKERIEEVGTPLKKWNISINYGIKTGLNEAFIIDKNKKEELIKKDPKCAEIIKPLLRGRDIKRYKIDFAGLWILYIHNGYGNNSSINVQNNYPAIWDYLNNLNKKLNGAIEKRYDQGNHWTNLRNCAYNEDFTKEKIIYAEIVFDSAFYFDTKSYYPEATSFILTGEKCKYLTAFLNSKLLTYAFKTFYAGGDLRGNTFRYKKVFLENLPIPKISIQEQLPFEILVDCVQFAKEKDMNREAELFESVIDGLVYDIYFKEEMKKANCHITARIAEIVKPFKNNDTEDFKVEYIKALFDFCNKDKIISRGLIYNRTIDAIKTINGALK